MKKLSFCVLLLIFCVVGGYFYWQSLEVAEVEPSMIEGSDFSDNTLIEKARQLSKEPYQKSPSNLPSELKGLSYDEHRDIRFSRKDGPWFGKRMPFEVQFFHLGAIFENSIPINEIVNGKTRPIKYSASFFDFGKNTFNHNFVDTLGYAGFRLHYPLNSPAYYDELVSFLGASYFRALGKGQKYGLSARGLAIDTALQKGEEFPIFKEFWIEKPKRYAQSINVYALLDSPSVVGAYSFVITPGVATKMKVSANLFPRKNIEKLGIAPLTSMFLFGENTKNKFDDHRPEVHDSDGLLVLNGNNEWLWRPLDNSKYLRISAFVDNNPKGFGLMQRDKNIEHYLDFEANYEERPSAWVEPIGNWGNGMVQLVEIPSIQEIHDNIVAYWVPKEPILAGKEYSFEYNLSWLGAVNQSNSLSKIVSTYTGVGGVSGMLESGKRKFVVDYAGFSKNEIAGLVVDASASEGKIIGSHIAYNPAIKGASVYVDFVPNGKTSELRIALKKNDKIISEIWSYQWLQ